MLNSTIENIQINGAGRTCINLHDNDYQDTVRRAFCAVVPFAKTNVGFLFMNQSNNNLYEHLQCDGQYTCIEQAGGFRAYVMPDFTDRGATRFTAKAFNASPGFAGQSPIGCRGHGGPTS